MSLELIRESTKINYLTGEQLSQTIVEHDIIVPDINPDVLRILFLDGEVIEKKTEALQDKVSVKGIVRYKILYVSDDKDQSIKSINTSYDFSHIFDVGSSSSKMKARIKSDIEHIDYEILNGRKINVKTIVKLKAKIFSETEQNFVSELKGVEDLQVLRKNVDIYCYLGENTSNYTLDEALEIPAGKPSIKEILRTDVRITGKDYKIADDKIIAKGDINILTLYVGDTEERSIEFMEHEMSFTQALEFQGIGEDSECDIDYNIEEFFFSPEEDSDGELRILRSEVKVSIWAQANNKRNLEIISDAYSMNSKIDFENQLFKTNRVVCQDKSQVILKEVVKINGDNPDILQVFNVLSKPNLFESTISDSGVSIEGSVNNGILYVANNKEQPVFCHYSEIPFKHNVELENVRVGMNCEVDLEVEHCNFSMVSENEVEVRVIVNVNTKVLDEVQYSLITEATENEEDRVDSDSFASLTVYFSQPGDDLWKVAKKYLTTVEDVKKFNKIEEEKLEVGKQIIIPRKI
jgi:LysM repeat protein